MGMFDSISWGDDLPYTPEMEEIGLNKRNWDFQTKDLDCVMDCFVVQGGKLYVRRFRRENWVEGDPKSKSFMDRLGHYEREEPYLDPVTITTTVRMYDYQPSVLDQWDCWVEYEVIFDAGNVKSVLLVEFKKESDAERKASEKRWHEQREREAALWINRFFFYTRPYQWVARRLRRLLYTFANFVHKISNKL